VRGKQMGYFRLGFNLKAVCTVVVFWFASGTASISFARDMRDSFISAEIVKEAMNLQPEKNNLDEVIYTIKTKYPLLTKDQVEIIRKITIHRDATIANDSGNGLILVPTKTTTWSELEGNTPFHKSVLDIAQKEIQVLDIGCGSGVDVRTIVKNGGRVFAIDAEPEPLSILIKSLDSQHLSSVFVSLGKFPDKFELESNAFDAIILGHVIHYMNPNQLQKTFEQSYDALKHSGRLLLSTNSFEYNFSPSWNLESYASWKNKTLRKSAGYIFPTYKAEYSSQPHYSAKAHLQDFDFTAHNLKHAGFLVLEKHFFSIVYSKHEGKYISTPYPPSFSSAFSLVAKKP
jgi:SAM-dependent methyltransferase